MRIELSGMRILVTGATGFLGSHLCRALRTTNNDVHAVSRRPNIGTDGLRWWHADLADYTSARDLLTEIRPDLIFQLTTHGWGAPDLKHVVPTLRNDLMATVNVMAVATELKVHRIVVAGSLEEPQDDGAGHCVPSSPYAAAKCAIGLYARMFHRLYGSPVVVARIFMTYGPGQPTQKIVPHVIRALLQEQSPELADGRRLIDWIYVDDVVAGLLATAQAPHVTGRTIDIGSGTLVSIRQVVEQIETLLGSAARPVFGALPVRMMQPTRAANTAAAHALLDWRAATPLAEGLALTAEWYREDLRRSGRASQTDSLANEEPAADAHETVEPTA